MDESKSLNHTKWECKYHVVFIPKYRRKALYKELRRHLGEVFRQLAKQKESQIEEGHLLSDHVHMMIANTAEVRGSAGDRVHQREKRDSSGAGVRRTEAEFCGPALLGTRVLRFHGRTGRRSGAKVHSRTGRRGQATGANGTVVRSATRMVARNLRGRVSVPA